ncbi:MAG: hypothetical protein ACP5J0_04890 [Pyrobaculum sp.]
MAEACGRHIVSTYLRGFISYFGVFSILAVASPATGAEARVFLFIPDE